MYHLIRNIIRYGSQLVLIVLLSVLLWGKATAERADEVIVVGDIRIKPIQEVVAGIEKTMAKRVPVYSPDEVRDRLPAIARQHATKAVIALGHDSIEESLTLPASIPVLYAMVILPPAIKRPNTGGMYISTPVKEYVNIITAYLPTLRKISVIASPMVLKVLGNHMPPGVITYQAKNSFEFVDTVKKLDPPDALLLLPDTSLLSRTALEEIYLYSFRNKVPLLGISKKHVRQGALFALEFDTVHIGQRLGRMALKSLQGDLLQYIALPPQQFNLFINKGTAKKMGISIPDKMLQTAAAVYP